MKCPECVAKGKKSKVFVYTSGMDAYKAAYGIQLYYDEDGNMVSKIPDVTKIYQCSNGHSWQEEME